MKSINLQNALISFVFMIGMPYIILTTMYSCAKNMDDAQPSPALSITDANQSSPELAMMIDTAIKAQAANPCDSIYYQPVAWGGMLRVLPRTIVHGNRRGFGPYWQCKSFAWQLIQPTRFQQDSVRERVVFADADTIRYVDTFYICRKIKI